MQPIQGIHHITSFASDPQANVDFYHNVLGQRLVKTTVNFDDPGTYHFYYGDEVGSPGTIMTFFPWPGVRRGQRGNGEVAAIAYAISAGSVNFWRDHMAAHGVTLNDADTRFGDQVLTFSDPDGMPLELIVTDKPGTVRYWEDGPIPAEHALRGFHSVTLWLAGAEATARVLEGPMGYTRVGQEENRLRFRAAGDVGMAVDLVIRPSLGRGAMGAGSVHHVAFRAQDDSAQDEYRAALLDLSLGVTTRRDRQYFRSIYFREPGGVLFEIATDEPGFALDEPVETLGTSLKLPPWLEERRTEIENVLPPFTTKPVEKAPRDV